MIDLHRILVPTDLSKHSTNALKYAAAFAEKFGAEIHLLYVMQDLLLFLPDTVPVAPPVVQPTEHIVASVRSALERIVSDIKTPVQIEVREGSPFYEIIRHAKEKNIDLIVMGTHGRGAIAHVLMGSVAERVVRKAPCPVLTVRDPEHEFVHP